MYAWSASLMACISAFGVLLKGWVMGLMKWNQLKPPMLRVKGAESLFVLFFRICRRWKERPETSDNL